MNPGDVMKRPPRGGLPAFWASLEPGPPESGPWRLESGPWKSESGPLGAGIWTRGGSNLDRWGLECGPWRVTCGPLEVGICAQEVGMRTPRLWNLVSWKLESRPWRLESGPWTLQSGPWRSESGSLHQTFLKKLSRTLQTLNFLEIFKMLRVSDNFFTPQSGLWPAAPKIIQN